MSAELAARRTAAAAALADYRRAGEMDMIDRALWAGRLADVLMFVLFELNAADRAADKTPGQAGRLAEVRAVLGAFDWETDDRQYALEAIDVIVNRSQA